MTTLITIPVYYTQQYKTKDDKTLFLGLNWFRNSFFHQQNQVKRDMHELLQPQLKHISPMPEKYSVSYFYYYKSPVSDLPNVGPMASKWLMDTLQELRIVLNDNVKYLVEEHYYVAGKDTENPRIEAILTSLPTNYAHKQPKDFLWQEMISEKHYKLQTNFYDYVTEHSSMLNVYTPMTNTNFLLSTASLIH